jgi:nitrogen-specific signal transduction histidine kinase
MPKIETNFDPDLPLVSAIPQDIDRVLLNLSNNANNGLDNSLKIKSRLTR